MDERNMTAIKLLYNNTGNYRVHFPDVDALLTLCAKLDYHLADNGPTSDTYAPVTPAQARAMWQQITAIRTSADDRIANTGSIWRAVYLLDQNNVLAGVLGANWRYIDKSNTVKWYLDCGLEWDTTPLPYPAAKLIEAVAREIIAAVQPGLTEVAS